MKSGSLSRWSALALTLLVFLSGASPWACTSTSRVASMPSAPRPEVSPPPLLAPQAEQGRERSTYIARSQRGMVVAAHRIAAEAGTAMLAAGGNAIDAAVAASFAISVVRPQSTGIGGGGFMLYRRGGSQNVEVIDFRERAPQAARRDMYLDKNGQPKAFEYGGASIPSASVNGHLAVGVPGLVAGLVDVHAKHGRLPLQTVMAPAIEAAESGFEVYEGLATAIRDRAEVMRHFPATAALFLPKGRPLQVGDRLVQKDLAWTLRQIAAKGTKGFYEGEVADRLIAEIRRGRGIMTHGDLRAYQVKRREPVRGRYRGYDIVSMPPPSSGGAHILQILNILEETDYGAHAHGSVPSVHLLAEAMRRAFADRSEYLGDPDFVRVPLAELLSKNYARRLFRAIDQTRATPSSQVKPGNLTIPESPSTTHISVVDAEGHAVSTTQTINYTFGSCVVAAGTGVVLNDEMDDFSIKPGAPNAFGLLGSDANAIAAGKTMLSSMSPTMVFGPDGQLRYVLGSPGGPRIITATLQTILNVLDHRMDLPDAVHAARIHHQWYPDELRFEPGGLQETVRKQLEAMGHKVVAKGTIGDVQAIALSEQGLLGVADVRSEGAPQGL